jgi:membrane-bound lytic murein transglycosylase A
MIAQDTGSAIVGPARADIYFGSGEQAGASRPR